MVTCPYTGSSLSFATEAVGGLTLASGNTPAGCDVARNYEQLQFAACSHSEPDATDKTHLEPQPAANTDYVEIKSSGWFKVEFSALFDDLSDRRLIR